ncbi:MAG TPA: hypothetical protein VGR50_09025 [Terriglobales bacterium]|nr:hypothetical protein [Terriglobales bacterium]
MPDFYAAAERRIWRFQLALAALGIAGAWFLAGRPGAIGFAVGAAASSVNFLWLKQAVNALANKAVIGAAPAAIAGPEHPDANASEAPAQPAKRRSSSAVIWKFLGRYGLIGIVAYATLRYTGWNVKALLAGLFLFVAAILAEICVEIALGLKQDQHGT